MIVANPKIETASAIYKPEEDRTEISILWSNKNNSKEESYVKIHLKAGSYECTLIDHNNIIDSGNELYHYKKDLQGNPREIELKSYNQLGLNHEIKVPVIITRNTIKGIRDI